MKQRHIGAKERRGDWENGRKGEGEILNPCNSVYFVVKKMNYEVIRLFGDFVMVFKYHPE